MPRSTHVYRSFRSRCLRRPRFHAPCSPVYPRPICLTPLTVAPWAQLQVPIAPHSPQGRGGRPLSVRTVLRMDFNLQQSPLGGPAMEEALHVVPLSREATGMNYQVRLPDESVILRTWRRLAENFSDHHAASAAHI